MELSTYNSYTVVVNVSLVVELFLDLGVLCSGPGVRTVSDRQCCVVGLGSNSLDTTWMQSSLVNTSLSHCEGVAEWR